jgi:diguanylate cyclase (GGDEF)-like protein
MASETAFPSQFRNDMGKLQQAYLERLKGHLTEFRRLREMTAQNILPRRDLQHLYRLSHQLAGSGATFGFPEISRTARELHMALKEHLDAAQPEGAAPVPAIILERLQAFERICQDAVTRRTQEGEGLDLVAARPLQLDKGGNDVYIIASPRDAGAAKKLSAGLVQFGYGAFVVNDLEAFRSAYNSQYLKAVVIFTALDEDDLGAIQGITRTNAAIPVIIVAPYDDFEARLSAARLGARGYFAGTPETLAMVGKIEEMSARFDAAPSYRVLIVDDDEMLAQFYSHSLERAGMKTQVVGNAKAALEALAANEVNLLLVDYDMPGCNGQELSSVIRQHDKYLRIPIVFISSQEDIEDLLINTGLGIDDFLVKPFTPTHLLSVVKSRAQRADELAALMVRDSFTGLLNHARFNETLAAEVLRARRDGKPAAYAILDIDHFKAVNDTHGHQAGDQVLKTLSRMLQQCLRRTDVVGRCGGEEFGVLMPGCTLEQAQQALESLRAKVAESFFDIPGAKLRVTFSAGLTLVDGTKTADELLRQADAALYRAKQGGRNQVVTA